MTVHDNGRVGGHGGAYLVAEDINAVQALEEEMDALFGSMSG